MTARTGMANLILRLRGMINAGTADWTLGTANYWDDDHVQEVLDRYRGDVYHALLSPVPKYVGGSIEYYDYRSPYGHLESGTAVLTIEDAAGADQAVAGWTGDYVRGIFTFTTDRKGTSYFLTGRSYDLNRAAADVWRQKAAHFTEHYSFSTDNHNLSRGQIIDNCLKMASDYEAKAQPYTITIGRGDS